MIEKSLEQSGNLFTYMNQKCTCLIDEIHDETGAKHYTLKLKAIPGEFYKFAYAPIDGLVMINPRTGALINETKVVEDFLSIKYKDITSISSFIKKYGFVLPISDATFTQIPVDEITPILFRFKILVHLLSSIGTEEYDYNKILKFVYVLILQQPRSFEVPETAAIIKTCMHPFTQTWFNQESVPELNNFVDTFNNDPYVNYYEIQDSFTKKTEHLDYVTYNDEAGNMDSAPEGYEYSQSHYIFNALTFLYRNAVYQKPDDKLALDFLYHYNKNIQKINSISPDGILCFDSEIDLNTFESFTKIYKDNLIDILKKTVKNEFDFALYSIRPVYNSDTMSPSWELPDLFTAMYFSLFYMRPDYEIYRQCINPNCRRLFKVKTTNSRQQYHNTACQNAAAQMRHRKKIK